MKKRMIIFLCALLAASALSGCGDKAVVLSEMKTDKYVTLGEYKGIEISKEIQDEVRTIADDTLLEVAMQNNQWAEADRPAQSGDRVNIDYVGKKDGVEFEGGSAEGYNLLLGSHQFIDGFEDGLVGTKTGDVVELNLTFPDPYPRNEELSGAPVVFTVTVNAVDEPKLTDEYIKSLNSAYYSTVEEYREFLYNQFLEEKLIDILLEKTNFIKDPPQSMVDANYERIIKNLTNYASAYGVDFNTLITTYYGTTMEDFEAQAKEGATMSAKESIILQAIANAEGITISDEEINAVLQEEANRGGYESIEAYKTALGDADYRDYVMCDKVMALLRENAVLAK